jgi:hypothetical protein
MELCWRENHHFNIFQRCAAAGKKAKKGANWHAGNSASAVMNDSSSFGWWFA